MLSISSKDSPRRFSYYKKLGSTQQRIYDQSDRITNITLNHADKFQPYVGALALALERDDKNKTQEISQKIVIGLCRVFGVPGIKMVVLAKRPSHSWGELHGLYERDIQAQRAKLTVWMRTAKRKDVVSFKTFLRTIVHEFIHHLDYTRLRLADSFHTQGFYKRESSLLKQLLNEN